MKRIYKYILFLIVMFIPLIVRADRIYNVDMHVNIDKEGIAHIEEVWDVRADDGTEWYKAYTNMENIELSDFKVSMDGKELEQKSYWNVNGSLESKSGYYGVHNISDGFELCFGKKDLRRHKFTLNYNLSNMIFNTEDSEVLYFTFIPKATIDNYSIVIDSYYEFPDTLDVWGYGAKGYAYVENGKIKMSNDGNLYNNYVTLLVKFPKDVFNTTNHYDRFNTFDDVYKMAQEGTFTYDYGDVNNTSSSNNLFDILCNIFGMIFSLFFYFLPFFFVFKVINNKKYGFKDNKKIDKNNTPMFREIPCNKDIYYANALVKLNNFDYKETNILGAILLKWVKEDRIKFINEEEGIFNKNTTKIDMTQEFIMDANTSINEAELFKAMYDASEDGFLETKEFEKWAKKHYSKFFSILGDFVNKKIEELEKDEHIYKRKNKKECKYGKVMDDMLYKDSQELYGLKLFLEEFSEIDKKEVIEVKLWDEYLMFAYLFGIADKVAKQFKNLYPEIVEDMQVRNLNVDFNTILFINSITTRSASAATSARNSARSAASSYSGGGGGFSSGGGGGGSFGGGGSSGGGSMGGR